MSVDQFSNHHGMNTNATNMFEIEKLAELARVSEEIWTFTKAMGDDLLVGFPDPKALRVVLNLPCGPGDWAIDVAFRYPHLEVAGIDESKQMVECAQAKASSQGLKNISFGTMDLRRPLDFSDQTFDAIHGRSFSEFLLRDQWHPMFTEILRILRPGGVFRLVYSDSITSNSPAFQCISDYVHLSLAQAGYGFSPTGKTLGIAPVIEHLLRKAGFSEVRLVPYVINFSAGTANWHMLYHNLDVMSHSFIGALQQQNISTERIQALYQQAHIDIMSEDFSGIQFLYAVYGTRI